MFLIRSKRTICWLLTRSTQGLWDNPAWGLHTKALYCSFRSCCSTRQEWSTQNCQIPPVSLQLSCAATTSWAQRWTPTSVAELKVRSEAAATCYHNSFFTVPTCLPLEISTHKHHCSLDKLSSLAGLYVQLQMQHSTSDSTLSWNGVRDAHRHTPSPTWRVRHIQYLWDSTIIPDIALVGKHISYVAQFSLLHILLNWV